MQTTYSLLDLSGTMVTPIGAYTFTGEGAGEVIVTMATEKTVHDVAGDGSIMVSKIAGENGTVTINVQQTSLIHKFLLNWYNAINTGDTSIWAATSMLLRNTYNGSSHVITGISPQKIPDKSYQAQGQRVSWVLMAANIINTPM